MFTLRHDAPPLATQSAPDRLDYVMDLSRWLPDDDTLVSATAVRLSGDVEITPVAINPTPLRVRERNWHREIPASRAVVVWATGGTAGVESTVRVSFETAAGRRDAVDFALMIV